MASGKKVERVESGAAVSPVATSAPRTPTAPSDPAAYDRWFTELTGHAPHEWQRVLAFGSDCTDRSIRIPTGFGKTAGTVGAWLWNRLVRGDGAWPRRLVFCLPMRVLVEQTERTIRDWIARANVEVGVHVLMGGVRAGGWIADMDTPAILVGTQDMLLSRALNRGYAAGRALWPMEFGLLHRDALWVLDEVQLMDVGLATSLQLSAFRDADAERAQAARPCRAWWMSATLQRDWLSTVDHPAPATPPLAIAASKRRGGLFDVRKKLGRSPNVADAAAIADVVRARHTPGTLTLVIANRVRDAIEIYDAVLAGFSTGKGKKRELRSDAPDLRLVHSRYRGAERAAWSDEFLRRDADIPAAGRVIVATQVVEAGVDISASLLVTALAPWPSLVQRFGRVARYAGEAGEIEVVRAVPAEAADAAPYDALALAAADEALGRLVKAVKADASPRSLEAFEDELRAEEPDFLGRLYPYEPLHVLRRRDLDDLFDTSADLSGADIDVSRFIRSGEDRDVTVFWRELEPRVRRVRLVTPVHRLELCPVPVAEIREWKQRAFVLDYLDGEWVARDAKRIVPGMVVLLPADEGGYTRTRGWDGKSAPDELPLRVDIVDPSALVSAASIEDTDEQSVAPWKTIATHGRETGEVARVLCERLALSADVSRLVVLAARWHDVGKAHEVFQDAIKREPKVGGLSARRDLAKAPGPAWRHPPYPHRPGFRHELASVLGLFELLRLHAPYHAALLGPHVELFAATSTTTDSSGPPLDHPLAAELASLSAGEFDLVAWLVCTHHGKVRCAWTTTPRDQEAGHGGIHGVCQGDALPVVTLPTAEGARVEVPAMTLSLAPAALGVGARYGASWGERVAGLLARHGPFELAFLEAVLRVADWRASALPTEDQHS